MKNKKEKIKKKAVRTKSKLGTTKPIKSKTSRSAILNYGTTTTLPYIYPWPKESWWRRWIEKFWRWVR